MSSYDRCSTCSEWGFTRTHECPPLWLVHRPDWHGDDPEEDHAQVYARSAEQAAERYIERADCDGDYDCVGGSPATVQVRRCAAGTRSWVRLEVEGRMVADYAARPVEGANR